MEDIPSNVSVLDSRCLDIITVKRVIKMTLGNTLKIHCQKY